MARPALRPVAWTVLVVIVGACTRPLSVESGEDREKAPADHDADGILDTEESPALLARKPVPSPAKVEAEFKADAPGGKDEKAKGKEGADDEVTTWRRSVLPANTSRLKIGDDEELPLRAMHASVKVDGFRARVMLDLFYYNPGDAAYEGNFSLRLPTDATPFYFGFGESAHAAGKPGSKGDVPPPLTDAEARRRSFRPEDVIADRGDNWINVKEARMVPPAKAAYAYGETVRRSIDPALLEWAGAGVFTARVFPLSSRKLHRVVLGYDVSLVPAGDDLEYRFDLPEGAPPSVVTLDVAELGATPIRVTPTAKGESGAGRRYFRFNSPSSRVITVRYDSPGNIVLTGTDPGTGPYLAARVRPRLPEGRGTTGAGAPAAVFLLDTSLSSNPEGFNVWLKMMEAVLTENRDSIREFAVLYFGVDATWWRTGFTANNADNVASLMADAGALSLEGATDLGAAFSALAANDAVKKAAGKTGGLDLFLLSDSAATWGETDPHAVTVALAGGALGRVYAYNTGLTGTDGAMLHHIARETGGAVFSVVGEAEVPKAARAHRGSHWRLEGLATRPGDTSDLMVAGRPGSVFPDQSLLIAGRGHVKKGAEIVLRLSDRRVAESVSVRADHVIPSELAPRLYGQIATGWLDELEDEAEDYNRAFACHFRITGRACSLLMLETDADYARFGIRPAADVLVVKKTLVTELTAGLRAELAASLGDPRRRFIAWMEDLEEIPGVEVELPMALTLLVKELPTATFAVTAPPLATRIRNRSELPGPLRDALAARRIDYDALSVEADRRRKAAGAADGLKALSSLVEHSPGDLVLVRDVAFRAMEWGLGAHAYHLFRRAAVARPWEPHNYHSMARVLEESGRVELAIVFYEVALAGNWDSRFGEFRRIVSLDYLRMLNRMPAAIAAKRLEPLKDFVGVRRKSLTEELDIGAPDLVVSILWNTDSTDVDLHVFEPTGEECYYSHADTKIGGHITSDVTGGYGPEMYILKKAVPGRYRVRAHYFASARNRASARSKVYATVYTHWGTPEEKVIRKVVTLAEGKDDHAIVPIDL